MNDTARRLAVTAARFAVLPVATMAAWFAILVGAYISMVADYPAGRVVIVVVAASAPVVIVWAMSAWMHLDRRVGTLLGAAAGAAAGAATGVAFGVYAIGFLPAGPHALTIALNKIEDPEGIRRIEQYASGDTICFDTCPSADRVYRSVLPHPEVLRRVAAVARAAGYRITPHADQNDELTATKGRYKLTASFDEGHEGADPRVLYMVIEDPY